MNWISHFPYPRPQMGLSCRTYLIWQIKEKLKPFPRFEATALKKEKRKSFKKMWAIICSTTSGSPARNSIGKSTSQSQPIDCLTNSLSSVLLQTLFGLHHPTLTISQALNSSEINRTTMKFLTTSNFGMTAKSITDETLSWSRSSFMTSIKMERYERFVSVSITKKTHKGWSRWISWSRTISQSTTAGCWTPKRNQGTIWWLIFSRQSLSRRVTSTHCSRPESQSRLQGMFPRTITQLWGKAISSSSRWEIFPSLHTTLANPKSSFRTSNRWARNAHIFCIWLQETNSLALSNSTTSKTSASSLMISGLSAALALHT